MSNWRETVTLTLTTNSGGSASAYSPVFTGEVEYFLLSDTANFDAGFSINVSVESTSEVLWQETNPEEGSVKRPALSVTGTDGVADPAAQTAIGYAQTRLIVAITAGGNTKTGIFKLGIKGSFSGA